MEQIYISKINDTTDKSVFKQIVDDYGNTTSHLICQDKNFSTNLMLDLIQSNKLDLNTPNKFGETALHYLTSSQNQFFLINDKHSLYQTIKNYGYDFLKKDINGYTPLMHVCALMVNDLADKSKYDDFLDMQINFLDSFNKEELFDKDNILHLSPMDILLNSQIKNDKIYNFQKSYGMFNNLTEKDKLNMLDSLASDFIFKSAKDDSNNLNSIIKHFIINSQDLNPNLIVNKNYTTSSLQYRFLGSQELIIDLFNKYDYINFDENTVDGKINIEKILKNKTLTKDIFVGMQNKNKFSINENIILDVISSSNKEIFTKYLCEEYSKSNKEDILNALLDNTELNKDFYQDLLYSFIRKITDNDDSKSLLVLEDDNVTSIKVSYNFIKESPGYESFFKKKDKNNLNFFEKMLLNPNAYNSDLLNHYKDDIDFNNDLIKNKLSFIKYSLDIQDDTSLIDEHIDFNNLNYDAILDKNNNTLLHAMFKLGIPKKEELDNLFNKNLNFYIKDNKGNTPLHYLLDLSNKGGFKARFKADDTLLYVINHFDDFNCQNNDGNTPIHLLFLGISGLNYEAYTNIHDILLNLAENEKVKLDLKNNEKMSVFKSIIAAPEKVSQMVIQDNTERMVNTFNLLITDDILKGLHNFQGIEKVFTELLTASIEEKYKIYNCANSILFSPDIKNDISILIDSISIARNMKKSLISENFEKSCYENAKNIIMSLNNNEKNPYDSKSMEYILNNLNTFADKNNFERVDLNKKEEAVLVRKRRM